MSPAEARSLIDRLWTAHFSAVVQALRRRGVAEGDLDDITANVFVARFRELSDPTRLDDDPEQCEFGRLPGALHRLARQHAFNYRRGRARAPSSPLPDLSGFADADASDDGQARMMFAQLRRLLDDDRSWEALVLHRLEGYTYEEVAALLECSPRRAKDLVAQAVSTLEEKLKRGGR